MYYSTAPEGFPSGIRALKEEILSSVHCALPGTVQAFDPGTGTAAVQPAARSGAYPMPVLYDVPVYLPEQREIRPGDFCLLIFADCDIDAWFASGNAEEPASARRHSLSDAFAFVGFFPGRANNASK